MHAVRLCFNNNNNNVHYYRLHCVGLSHTKDKLGCMAALFLSSVCGGGRGS